MVLKNINTFKNFSKNNYSSKDKLNKILNNLKAQGKNIVGYGAPAKSTTILNFCEIDYNTIDVIYDNSSTKIGKYTPGKSLIKIENSDNFKFEKSEYCVLFAWNHKEEILNKEKNFTNNGGKWIIPVENKKII